MRIRTIKPEFWIHPVMSRLEDASRLAAIGLLNVADDEGYFLASPQAIRSALWPFDESSSKARRAIDDLSRIGYIEVSEHPTHGPIGRILNFKNHQKIDRPNSSKLKAYFDSTNVRRMIDEQSSTEQGTGNREQGMDQGKEKEGEAQSPTAPRRVRESFDVNSIVIPPELQGAQFLEFWPQWVAIRLKKPKPPDGWQKYFQEQVDWLKGYGASVAGATVEESYRGRWQGLFPDKHAGRAVSGAANGIPTKPQKTDGGGHEVIMGKYL